MTTLKTKVLHIASIIITTVFSHLLLVYMMTKKQTPSTLQQKNQEGFGAKLWP